MDHILSVRSETVELPSRRITDFELSARRISLGLGYGGLFGLAPIIALELFGMESWSMK